MRIRPTVRLIVVDEQQRVLLFKFEDPMVLYPNEPELQIYWLTPGGGVEANESYEAAGIRELWEETGIEVPSLGAYVWHRERTLHFPDESVHFDERYYLTPVTNTEVNIGNFLPYELDVYRAHKWWSVEEIRQSDEVFLPFGLAELLQALINGKIPAEPLQLYK